MSASDALKSSMISNFVSHDPDLDFSTRVASPPTAGKQACSLQQHTTKEFMLSLGQETMATGQHGCGTLDNSRLNIDSHVLV